MKYLILLIIGFVAIIQGGCYYENEEELYGDEECFTGRVSYSGTVAVIISNNCLGCHNQGDREGDVILDSYDEVRSVAESGKLIGVITHADGFPFMPKDAPKLSECDIRAIRTWIDEGSLND